VLVPSHCSATSHGPLVGRRFPGGIRVGIRTVPVRHGGFLTGLIF